MVATAASAASDLYQSFLHHPAQGGTGLWVRLLKESRHFVSRQICFATEFVENLQIRKPHRHALRLFAFDDEPRERKVRRPGRQHGRYRCLG